MHELVGADDCVHRTCLNTLRAPDTFFFDDEGNQVLVDDVFISVQSEVGTQKIRDTINRGLPARWTAIYRLSIRYGFGIGRHPGCALAALRLR